MTGYVDAPAPSREIIKLELEFFIQSVNFVLTTTQ